MHPPGPATFDVPKGTCDCHVHVFGPFDKFPLAATSSYTAPPAVTSDLIARMDMAGVTRAVIVQPSGYGTDNRCTLHAARSHPDRLRAVAVIDGTESDADLRRMHEGSVRGIRLNILSGGGPTAASFRTLAAHVAERIRPHGWHIQVYAPLATIAENAKFLIDLPIDIVLDHMGKPNAAAGPNQPGFDTLLGLLRSGKFWVKISGPFRISPDLMGNADVVKMARTIIEANPDRAVWGSDWPWIGEHSGTTGARSAIFYRPIDYGALLSIAPDWAGSAANLRKLLVDNAARLYGFSA
jgi:predicted TIM-barrel fold metal-dependent hydrolase